MGQCIWCQGGIYIIGVVLGRFMRRIAAGVINGERDWWSELYVDKVQEGAKQHRCSYKSCSSYIIKEVD